VRHLIVLLVTEYRLRIGKNVQLLAAEGTQRPVWPLTLQTSCFKLVLATQHWPLGTGRPAFWGVGVAMAKTARERMVAMVNCILLVVDCWFVGLLR
jgi:hypothetical protein